MGGRHWQFRTWSGTLHGRLGARCFSYEKEAASSAIHNPQSYMIRVHSRFEHFLEESAPRGCVALPAKETRLQETRIHRELQRPAIEAKPDWHGRNGVKANKMKKGTLQLCALANCCKEFAFCGRPLKEPLGRTGGQGKGGWYLDLPGIS